MTVLSAVLAENRGLHLLIVGSTDSGKSVAINMPDFEYYCEPSRD